MSRLGNFSLVMRFNGRKETPPTVASENTLLAQMEIFVIVVAVIAVAAAIILLVLLQLRIKKQTAAEAVSRRSRVQPASEVVEEIALDYPANDGILKNGPPPYRQVMKSPELYPLAPSTNIGNGDVKIQIPTSPLHNTRTKRTWNQFLNAVLRADDQGLNIPSGKHTSGDNTPTSNDSFTQNSPVMDEVLPTYDEVRLGFASEESKVESCRQKPSLSRRDSADIVKSGQYNFLGFNFGIEETKLCKNDCVFTISNALQTVITEERMRLSRRPRLATL
ncbi:Hypothetical predicted protein [Paramuricea clavata]|nr:Hypothetical predicted protein [Paramuricea clavata]